ncbi:EF-hand domain-containing protein [Yoonia sp. R2331]|uniref:EF-hand domain-containing protein n=1 Tax=Yoonia sp. R2331 TaxID=3237238 RepID=UPI0034E4851A
MKTQILMIAIAAGLTLNAVPVAAQDRADRPDFATLDADGDGMLTLEEMQAAGAARFAAADADGDGALSAEELTAQMSERAARGADRMIERLDENGDGLLQQAEMQDSRMADRAERLFARADADEDGSISAEEFEAVKERMGKRGGGKRGGKGRGHGGRG